MGVGRGSRATLDDDAQVKGGLLCGVVAWLEGWWGLTALAIVGVHPHRDLLPVEVTAHTTHIRMTSERHVAVDLAAVSLAERHVAAISSPHGASPMYSADYHRLPMTG